MRKLFIGLMLLGLVIVTALFISKKREPDYLVFEQSYQLEGLTSHLGNIESQDSESPEDRLELELKQLVNPITGKLPTFIRQRELDFAKNNLNRAQQTSEGESLSKASAVSSTEEQTSSFVNFGPYNIGGRTRGMGIDIANEDIILAGSVSGGMWRSTDAGATWARTTALEQHPAVSTLVQDQREGRTNEWYYGTGERLSNTISINGDIYLGNGIYKSVDNGVSWDLISATAVAGTSGTDVIVSADAEFSIIGELAIDFSNAEGTEVYAAGTSEIIRSIDGFETFDIVLGENNTGANNSTDVAVTPSGKVYATIANANFNGDDGVDGFFKSDDGISWTEIEFPAEFPTSFPRIELGVDPSNEDRVFLITSLNLFVYNDQNETWEDRSAFLDANDDNVRNGHNAQFGYNLFIKVHPDNSDAVFAGGSNILRSQNGYSSDEGRRKIGGYTATAFYPNHHPDNHKLAFYPSDGNKALSSTDGGVFRTDDIFALESTAEPVTWESLNNGYLTAQFFHIDINNYDLGDNQIVGGMQDNGSWAFLDTDDPADDWLNASGGDGAFTAFTYNSLYVSAQSGFLVRFEQTSQNFYAYQGEISPSDIDAEFSFINPFIYNPVHQDQIIVGAAGRIYVTDDARTNPGAGDWTAVDGPSSFFGRVSAFGVSTQPEGIVYFGTQSSELYKIVNTREITVDTEILELDTEGLPDGNVSGIAVDPNDGSRLIATFSNYEVISIWYSEDGGGSWASISGNLEENADGSGAGPSVKAVDIMPDGSGGNYYFIGTSVGLFMTRTLDGDNTVWVQQAENEIGNVLVSSIKSRPIEGVVAVGTHGNGVFKGAYEVGITPNINYSWGDEPNTAVLRGNVSFVEGKGMSYEWLKDGAVIEGENTNLLNVVDGGDYQLRLGIEGVEETGLSNIVSFNFDGTGPDVTTITRLNPTDQATDLTTVQFQVTFSETVFNVSADDFEITSAASGVIGTVTESTVGTVFDVTVNNIGGSGELNLDIAASNNITDEIGNAFSGTVLAEETYIITDNTAPAAAITRGTPSTELTDQNEVTFIVTFTEGVNNVDVTDFALSTGSPTATLGAVTETAAGVYEVIVTDILADGTLGLDFVSGQDIADNAGNAFDGTVTTDLTYTIENVITAIDDPLARNAQRIIADANPSSGIFNLAFPRAFIGDFDMQVVDSRGRRVSLRAVKGYNTGDQVELDLTASPDGVYILNASNGQTRATIKLLKSVGSR